MLKQHVVVVGAGAFGGWTALSLLRSGARVTLVDAWGPGNSRASSGGETRILRATYKDRIYTDLVARALPLWLENEQRWGIKLFHQTGVLWMADENDALERAAAAHMRDAGLPFEELSAAEAARRYPQINFDGIRWALRETHAGFLLARRACAAVLESFRAEGGTYIQAAAEPGAIERGALKEIKLSDGSALVADQYVFACGPWLGKLFPDVIGERIKPTRQDVFFFGTPAGDARFTEESLGVWLDYGTRAWYGIAGNESRGFKIANDTRGPAFDPTNGDRTPDTSALKAAREYVAFRFPALRDAPLVESRVCQYEQTADSHFIIDRHPRAQNVWLAGGGSGHGFKFGPALGEWISQMVLGRRPVEPTFSFARF
ncbi:MAG: FAD-dependent oxidoreductase [Acidobacteria bacterium]|nr:FAD-dependent oxidoreductase [Acidobacteriota bacterium]MCL5288975.1 FAD-dependent oxidoreductase [Acidobacteriota bacterium]